MLEKDFTLHPEALELKQLGFDEPCIAFYQTECNEDSPIMVDDDKQYLISGFRTCRNSEMANHYISAPTYSQVFRWFREKYGLSGWINESFIGDSRQGVISIKSEIGLKYYQTTTKLFDTYEEAELGCLKKLIGIVKSSRG
jgi:hypothetical protein